MEGINFIINTLVQNKHSDSYIINHLMDNYNKTIDESTEMLIKWRQNMEFKTDIYVNNKIKVESHPGFECSMYIGKIKNSYEPKNIIKIMNINNIKYMKYIDIYIYSLIKTFIFQEKKWDWVIQNCKTKKLIEKLNINDKNIDIKLLTPTVSILTNKNTDLEKLEKKQDKKILYVDEGDNEDMETIETVEDRETLNDLLDSGEVIDFNNVDDDFDDFDDLNFDFTGGAKKDRKLLKTNYNKIELSGQKNYWSDRIKNVFPEYAGKSDRKGWRSYAKVCQSQYKRVPVLINDDEKTVGLVYKCTAGFCSELLLMLQPLRGLYNLFTPAEFHICKVYLHGS